MSFRHNGKSAHDWRCWVDANHHLIDELQLPTDVVATRQDFEYLLQHGYNRAGWWNEQPWFELWALDQTQFWTLLESYVNNFYPAQDRQRQLEELARSFRPSDS